MHEKFTSLDPRTYAYLVAHCSAPEPLDAELMAETAELGGLSMMQIAAEQAAFMAMLVKLSGARRAVEVGTFTGYSALCVARALPDDGKLLCCDVSEEWTSIGKRYWERAGVADKIELVIAPAIETLRALPLDDPIDFAFIDADKGGYRGYYEEIIRRMPTGGMIVVDNVLWMGLVADPNADDEDTVAIRELNDFVAADPRVEVVMIPVGDGLTLARVR